MGGFRLISIRRSAIAVAAGVLLALPSAAGAAVVSQSSGNVVVSATGDPLGTVNNITATISSSTVSVTASAGSLTAGSGCTGSGTITCADANSLSAGLGDGNDVWDSSTVGLPGLVDAGSGDDSVKTGFGNSTINLGAGMDSADAGLGSDTINGGSEIDSAVYSSRTLPVVLSADGSANDGYFGESDNIATDVESILGGAGGDIITAPAGVGYIAGGPGNDTLNGDTNDTVGYWERTTDVRATLGVGGGDPTNGENDTFDTEIHNIIGGSGNDVLIGDAGPNLVMGGWGSPDGDDVLRGGGGADHLIGGLGTDTADYSDKSQPVTVNLDGSGFAGTTSENDDLDADIENVIGGSAGDTIIGNGANNSFDGGLGADSFDGAGGNDRVDYSARSATVTVSLDDVANDGASGENDNVGGSIEDVTGGSAGDSLTGSSAANSLDGGPGADTLHGLGGSDVLTGAAGDDVFHAREGVVDTIACGDGTDSGTVDDEDLLSGDCEATVERTTPPPVVEPPTDDHSGDPDAPVTPPADNGQTGGGTTPTTGSTDTTGGDNGDADLPTDDDGTNPLTPEAPVKISAPAKLEVSASGDLSLSVTCTALSGTCKGDVSIYENAGTLKANTSKVLERRTKGRKYKRGKLLARRNYSVRAGRKTKVSVRLNRHGRRRVIKSRKGSKKKTEVVKAIIAITVKSPDGTISVSEKAVQLKQAKERRIARSKGRGTKNRGRKS